MLVPINLTGGHYKEKSASLSNQRTRNFWPKAIPTEKARSQYVLQSFYGLKTFKSQTGGADRGMVVNQGNLYKVTDTTLYQVSSDGTHTSLGYIGGSNRCTLRAFGSHIIIVNGGGVVYVWDGTTLTEVTNANLGTPQGAAVLNSQAIYDAGSGQGFDVSDVGDAAEIDGLNNASAESASDALVVPYAFSETLYLLGEETIELWWNSGQGNPPFDKIQGALINIGIGAKHSIAENPDFIFLLGADRQFHTLTGGTSAVDTVISTPAMAKELQDYTIVDDCIGWMMQLEGQYFYTATFPTQDVTWVYPVGGEWFEWGSSIEGRIRANSYVKAFGKHLVGDHDSGNIYELDAETYTDAGHTIPRVRDSAPIHSGLLRQDGKPFVINELQLFLQTGVGLPSGQGSDPLLEISVSKDGGKTFGTPRMKNIGRSGDTNRKVIMKNFGRFEDSCVVRLSVSDPVPWTVFNAKVDMELCI